jgi:hypothetical protein
VRVLLLSFWHAGMLPPQLHMPLRVRAHFSLTCWLGRAIVMNEPTGNVALLRVVKGVPHPSCQLCGELKHRTSQQPPIGQE